VGYGGSCFPKDVKGLIKTAEEYEYDFKILKAIDNINLNQKLLFVEKIINHFEGNIKGKTFALWGLSYKPRTDDIREAPAITVIQKLSEVGAKVQAFDPAAMDNFKQRFAKTPNLSFCSNNYDALKNASALILVTEWNEFRKLDIGKMKKLMKEYVIFDGRNIYNPEELKSNGFVYYGIGK
jgi:UDPglucose 6-dehydrogenase